jgi:hypothetical protein
VIPAVRRDHEVRAEGRVYARRAGEAGTAGLEAAERFARGDEATVIAADLRVTERTVRRWRKVWREGGAAALKSKGPVSPRAAVGPAVGAAGDGAEARTAGPRLQS